MFKIRGSDGREFGPVIPTVVRQWISHGKADANTLLQKVGESEWKPLSAFAEFRLDLPAADAPEASLSPSPVRAPAPTLPQRTSRMAIASLVLGLLGFFVVPGIVGLILGIIAQTRISLEGGRLNGKGLALAGMITSGLMLLVGLPFWSALILPAIAEQKAREAEATCLDHTRQLSQALVAYAGRHEDTFPSAASWCDALKKEGLIDEHSDLFLCPSAPKLKCGFAFNEMVSEKKKSEVTPNTVLIFESSKGWNGAGGPYDLGASRHRSGIMAGFADGTADIVPMWQVPQLKWNP